MSKKIRFPSLVSVFISLIILAHFYNLGIDNSVHLSKFESFLVLGGGFLFITGFVVFLATFKRIDDYMALLDKQVKQWFSSKDDNEKSKIGLWLFLLSTVSFIIMVILNEGFLAFSAGLIFVFSLLSGICFSISSNNKTGEYIKSFLKVFLMRENNYYEAKDEEEDSK